MRKRKVLIFSCKEAYDGTIFDDPPNGFMVELPFFPETLETEEVYYPLYKEIFVYAIEG
jgi:hypothetical protein